MPGRRIKVESNSYDSLRTPDRQDFIIANLREDVDKQVLVA